MHNFIASFAALLLLLTLGCKPQPTLLLPVGIPDAKESIGDLSGWWASTDGTYTVELEATDSAWYELSFLDPEDSKRKTVLGLRVYECEGAHLLCARGIVDDLKGMGGFLHGIGALAVTNTFALVQVEGNPAQKISLCLMKEDWLKDRLETKGEVVSASGEALALGLRDAVKDREKAFQDADDSLVVFVRSKAPGKKTVPVVNPAPKEPAPKPAPTQQSKPSPQELASKSAIQAAFGIPLGAVWKPALKKEDESIYRWGFEPDSDSKNDYFTDYQLWTSPLSRTVIGIGALGKAQSVVECRKEAKEILALLEAKYPSAFRRKKGDEPRLFDSKIEKLRPFNFLERMSLGGSFIELSCVTSVPMTKDFLVGPMSGIGAKLTGMPYMKLPQGGDLSMVLQYPNVYSGTYINYSKGVGLTHNLGYAWGYPEGDAVYRPVPSPFFSHYESAETGLSARLCIRYGNEKLEKLTARELVEARRRDKLRKGKGTGF